MKIDSNMHPQNQAFNTEVNFFVTAIVSFVITVILIYIFGLNSNERNILNSKLKQLINRPLPGKIG